jgi:transcriptional regulator GlxA family with amidase domain
MNPDTTFKEKATEAFRTMKNKVNLDEARRAVRKSRDYVRTISLASGFALGYIARAVGKRRHAANKEG